MLIYIFQVHSGSSSDSEQSFHLSDSDSDSTIAEVSSSNEEEMEAPRNAKQAVSNWHIKFMLRDNPHIISLSLMQKCDRIKIGHQGNGEKSKEVKKDGAQGVSF